MNWSLLLFFSILLCAGLNNVAQSSNNITKLLKMYLNIQKESYTAKSGNLNLVLMANGENIKFNFLSHQEGLITDWQADSKGQILTFNKKQLWMRHSS